MKFSSSFIVFLAVPATVLACEGECIVGTTNAFLENYSTPIHEVLTTLASKICGMIPPHACPGDPLELLLPVKTAYDTHAYASLEHAIFPSYFHGKCQINGVNPSGCPNPDCSVVCGTPGSLVHFYPKLRSIVFEDTRGLLANATKPNSPSYKVVEKRVLDAAERGVHRMVKVRRGSARVAEMKKRQDNLKSSLRAIMGETSELLKEACGGEGLPLCSWARQMKAFILRYP